MSYDEKIFVFLLCLFVFLVVVCCALVYLFINKMKKVDEKNISNNILNQNSNNIT